jgi:AraC-like DNA-binding protein
MQVSGRGTIVVWEGASLWLLAAQRDVAGTELHTHHAIQITISLDGGFLIQAGERTLSGPVAVIAAGAEHDFEATGAVAFLFVEPESPAGRAITARLLEGAELAEIDPVPIAAQVAELRESLASVGPESRLIALGQEILVIVAAASSGPLPDCRVQAMIEFVRSNLDGAVSLPAAAGSACLSPSRARHLFAAETGMTFKSFVLWQRIGRAVELYASGRSLTESAHEAGFADSAHLSRTFRKTFGIPASQLEVR